MFTQAELEMHHLLTRWGLLAPSETHEGGCFMPEMGCEVFDAFDERKDEDWDGLERMFMEECDYHDTFTVFGEIIINIERRGWASSLKSFEGQYVATVTTGDVECLAFGNYPGSALLGAYVVALSDHSI